jgi:hypothetical protein
MSSSRLNVPALTAPEALGAVRAHHTRRDVTECHLGQGVPQERIEGEYLSVGTSFAWHHLIAITANDVSDRNALQRLVNLRSASSSCSRAQRSASDFNLNERETGVRPLRLT